MKRPTGMRALSGRYSLTTLAALLFGLAALPVAATEASGDASSQQTLEDCGPSRSGGKEEGNSDGVDVGNEQNGWTVRSGSEDRSQSDKCLTNPREEHDGQASGRPAPIVSHYSYTMSSSDTQASCYRVVAGYDGNVNAAQGRYASAATADREARGEYATMQRSTIGGGLLEGTDVADGVWRREPQTRACVDPANEIQAAIVTPLDLALIGWEAWAQPLAPAVLTEPTTYSVVGVPTIVSVDDYQPGYDIDGDPRTITWALPGNAIRLRATAHHRIRWHDEDDPETTDWLARNGRPYQEGDEDTGFDDPELITHTYTVKGDKTIQADVRWTGEWSFNGGAWEPLPADPIYLVQSFDIDVHEIQAVLTN